MKSHLNSRAIVTIILSIGRNNGCFFVSFPHEVLEKLVELGYDPAMGARPLRRTIQEQIEDGIAEYFLDHPETHELKATLNDEGEIVILPVMVEENSFEVTP